VTFDIVTIFPAMVRAALAAGVVGRAIDRGVLDVVVHDLRAFTTDRHRVVDDVPYGGGPGMVLKPEPIFRALEAVEEALGRREEHHGPAQPSGDEPGRARLRLSHR
jgi:tRNA (guanine37-N1)-methyltransferase